MRRALSWLAFGALVGMTGWCTAADPAPVKKESEKIVSPLPLPLPVGAQSTAASSAPTIVNGQLVYETPRTKQHSILANGPVRLIWDYVRSPQNQNEPDGFYTPLGAASFWTEWKYTYGSTKAFLGNADAAPTRRQFFDPELPPGYILRAWHPNRYGRVK